MTWILPKQLHTLACALDTAALSLDCIEQSEVCARSLFVRSKPSPSRTWSRKWMRDSWTRHLYGRILRPSLGQRFVTEWTSLRVDILANHSAAQASEPAKKIRGISGHGSQMVFDFSGPAAASLRTSKDISAWGCPTSSKTWQEWVTERRGAYSARLKSAHRTSASGSSSWPTTAARDHKGESGSGRQERKGHPADTLSNAVAQWPSPVASEVRQGFQDRSRGMKGSQESLTTVVIKHGPAVPASSSTDGSRPGLSDQQVKSWATARAGMARGNKFTYDRGKGNIEEQAGASVKGGGKLNPRWVETLMGLPVGWTMPSCVSPVTIERTSCDSSAMELCQPQPSGPSGC